MGIELTLRGAADATPHISGSINISKQVGARSTAVGVIRGAKATPEGGQEIGIFVDGFKLFGGIIQQVIRSRVGNVDVNDTLYSLTCIGWEHLLDRIVVEAQYYTGKNAGQVVTALLTDWASAEGVVPSGVSDGLSAADLGSVLYIGKTIAEIFDDLAAKCNFNWWVDPDKRLYFLSKSATTPGTIVISSANRNFTDFTISETGEDYVNVVKIGIAWDQINPTAATFIGDGTTRVWTLPDIAGEPQPVDHIDTINLNGISQDVGVLNVDTGKAYYFEPGTHTITQEPLDPVLTAADALQVNYFPFGRNVIVEQDTAEIAARAAIEGGSGHYELFIDDYNNANQVGAQKRAINVLDKRCPGRNGAAPGTWPRIYQFPVYSFQANASDLNPGSVISVQCNVPATDAVNVLIQSVDSKEIVGMTSTGSRGFFQHTVRAVDYIPVADYVEFYKTLAAEGGASTSPSTGTVGTVLLTSTDVSLNNIPVTY